MAFNLLGSAYIDGSWSVIGNPIQSNTLIISQSFSSPPLNRLLIRILYHDPINTDNEDLLSQIETAYPDTEYSKIVTVPPPPSNLASYTHISVALRQYYIRQVIEPSWLATIAFV